MKTASLLRLALPRGCIIIAMIITMMAGCVMARQASASRRFVSSVAAFVGPHHSQHQHARRVVISKSMPMLPISTSMHYTDQYNRQHRHTHRHIQTQNRRSSSMQLMVSFSDTDLWAVRVASAVSTYLGFLIWSDRPKGSLTDAGKQCLAVSSSSVAGKGVFVTQSMPANTVLGTYPGVVLPLNAQQASKAQQFPQCEAYVWRFSDNQQIIDPTDSQGICQDVCNGGSVMIGSQPLFEYVLGPLGFRVPTTLCRINEPPKGMDVNVVTNEDLETRTVTFLLERDVFEGEELFIDYGLTYDRTKYQ